MAIAAQGEPKGPLIGGSPKRWNDSFPRRTETQPELLACHYRRSRPIAEPAIAYWRMAGQRAAKRAANLVSRE